jgi:hypothetical protein
MALGVGSGLLTIWTFVWPPSSQPQAWSALLPLTAGFIAALIWVLRRQARVKAIARAAEGSRGGYRDLERARIQVTVRDFRMAGRFGLLAPVIPALIGLSGLIQGIRLRHAFPNAEVKVHLFEALVTSGVLSIVLVAASLYFLWNARRLEKAMKESEPTL